MTQRMLIRSRVIRLLVVCALIVLVRADSGRAAETPDAVDLATVHIKIPRPRPTDMIISRVVGDLISRHHYLRQKLDDDISSRWFDEYFRQLDHNHVFFLASDIEEFESYRQALDDLVLRRGNLDFAFDVYERFVKRVQEWYAFAENRINEPFDFDLTESILVDRREQPWPATAAEQRDLWRRRLKNSVIAEILSREAAAAEKAKKEAKKETEQEPVAEAVTPPPDEAQQPANEGADTQTVTQPATTAEQAVQTEEKVAAEAEAEKTTATAVASVDTAPAGEVEGASEPERTPTEEVVRSYSRYLRRKMDAEPNEIVEVFLTSLTKVYDPHSAYMAPETEEDFDISMSLSLQGIGAVLTTKDSYVEVVSIVPGGPADKDGRLKPGDRIIAVAQENQPSVDVVDMRLRKVVRMIRGERGSKVFLTVLPEGSSTKSSIEIVRDEVKLTEQEAKGEVRDISIPGAKDEEGGAFHERVAIVSLPSFYADFAAKHDGDENYKSSTRDVRNIIENTRAEGPLDGLILDLRSNGGGSLEEAISLAGLFFDEGPVVQVRKSTGQVRKRVDPDSDTAFDGPLVVMTDKFSASASEIVAAALQDYGRAVIVGDKETHGKGTVQTIYHLDNRLGRSPLFKNVKAGSLKFTMAKFYRISGGSTQVEGVKPDIVFPSFTDYMEVGEARLPHVLPWDEIEPLTISSPVDVRPLIPELQKRSQVRLSHDAEYQARLEDIERYGERRSKKTITLNLPARRELQQEEEAWAGKMRRFSSRGRSQADSEGDDKGKAPDLVLEETLHIMGDLIGLSTIPRVAAADNRAGATLSDGDAEPNGQTEKMP